MSPRIRTIIALLAIGVAGAPAQAATGHDLNLARQAYETGKASGIKPQTRGENRMCAAYWDVMHFMRKSDVLLQADWTKLGKDFDPPAMLIRKVGFKLDAGERDRPSDGFVRASEAALDRFQGFVMGDADKTRKLFENLGVCQRGLGG